MSFRSLKFLPALLGVFLVTPRAAEADPHSPVLWNPAVQPAWSFRYSLTTGGPEQTTAHGGVGDVPIVGDFDGDGVDEIGIVRQDPGSGNWAWYMSGTNTGYDDDAPAGFVRSPFQHGSPNAPFFDIPVVGDWNGDGVDTAGLVRRAGNGNMEWILTNNAQAGGAEIPFFQHGCHNPAQCGINDVPIVGDWNGDGIDTANLIRNSGGNKQWILTNNQYSGGAEVGFIPHGAFDQNVDLHVVGDWNGDGTDSIGIVRRAEQRWYLWSELNTPNDVVFQFGTGAERAAFGAAIEPPPPPPLPPPPITPAGMGAYGQAVMASGPVAYWRMEENFNPSTDTARLAGPPQQGPQDGRFQDMDLNDTGQPGPRPTDLAGGLPLAGFAGDNHAADFQGNSKGGNDVALYADDGNLNFSATRAFTLEAWVKGAGPQENGAAILAKGHGGGGEQYALDIVDGTFRFFAWDGGNPNTPSVVPTLALLDGSWQHVVAVFDQAEGIMKVYVNGQEVGSATPRATIIDNTHDVSVGARQNQSTQLYNLNFDGLIDEVAIYGRALSAAEIQGHFDAALVPEPSSCVLALLGLAGLAITARQTRKAR